MPRQKLIDSFSANPLRRIRKLLGKTLKDMANELAFSTAHVCECELADAPPRLYVAKLRTQCLDGMASNNAVRIESERLLAAPIHVSKQAIPSENTSLEKSGWKAAEYPPVEREAWSWALSFRNNALLEELAGHALRSNLCCRMLRDALVLTREGGERDPAQKGLSLFTEAEFGLHAGTAVILGATRRHLHAQALRSRFSELLGIELEFREFQDRPSFFAYPTVLKYMTCGKGHYHPERYMDGEAIRYSDIAGIFHSPIKHIFSKPHPYQGAKRVIWVTAAQRLANGVAVRMLRDVAFRAEYANGHNFEDDEHVGGFFFRVSVSNDGYGANMSKPHCLWER